MPIFEFTPGEPRTKEEILAELHDLHRVSSTFWNGFSTEAFFAPVGNGWSPAGNVRHLNKAIKPLNQALVLPRLALRTMFGKAHESSRSYTGIRDTYRGILASGAGAGTFAPEPLQSLGGSEADRSKLMATREDIANKLANAIRAWDEGDLDHYLLPHPLLGKLTIREMLLFMVYHNYHHAHSVATRLQGA